MRWGNLRILCVRVMGALAILIAGVLGGDSARGVTSRWLPAGAGLPDWFTPTRWDMGIPNAPGDLAILPGNIPSLTVAGPVTLGGMEFQAPGTQTISGPGPITFDNPGEAPALMRAYPPRGGAVTVTLGVPIGIAEGEELRIDVASGSQLTLSGGVASTGGDMEKVGVGSLVLGGNNASWDGDLRITSGAVTLAQGSSLGSTVGKTTVSNGASLMFLSSSPEPLDIDQGLVIFDRNLELSGPIQLVGESRITTPDSTGDNRLTLSGAITGDGPLHFAPLPNLSWSNSTIELRGDNSYTGKTYFSSTFETVNFYDRLYVYSPTGLGSPDEGTVVDGGRLAVFVPIAEPLELNKGTILFSSGANTTGLMTLRGGEVWLGTTHHTAPIEIANAGGNPTIVGGTIAGGTTGEGDLRLSSTKVDGLPLAHDGGVVIVGETTFQTPNSYTGKTVVEGQLFVNHAGALGTSTSPIEVNANAILKLNVVSDRDFIVNGSVYFMPNAPVVGDITLGEANPAGVIQGQLIGGGVYTGQITLEGQLRGRHNIAGGAINGEITGNAARLALNGVVDLNSANTYTGITSTGGTIAVNHASGLGATSLGTVVAAGVLDLNVPVDEPILIVERGRVDVNVQQRVLPRLFRSQQNDPRPVLAIEHEGAYAEQIDVMEGTLQVNENLSVRALVVREGGTVSVAPGKSLHVVSGNIDFLDGTLSGDLRNVETLVKRGTRSAQLGALPDFDGEIRVESGRLQVTSSQSLGTSTGKTYVGPTGQITVGDSIALDDHIVLGATDVAVSSGGILVANSAFDKASQFNGVIELAEEGSVITSTGNRGVLTMEGIFSGGALVGNGRTLYLYVNTPDHTYTGSTELRQGQLRLADQGALSTTSVIRLFDLPDHEAGELLLDNQQISLSDRVADSVPVEFYGGTLGYTSGTNEVLGTVRFVEGSSYIEQYSNTVPSTITINSLERSPGATALVHVGTTSQIRIDDPSFAPGEIIPWMIVDDYRTSGPITFARGLATYSDRGLVPITDYTSLALAGESQDARVTENQSLGASKSVRSLTYGSSSVVDLAGETLTVESGAIQGTGTLNGGTITAGALGGYELYLYGPRVGATIADNGENPVTVVVSSSSVLSSPNSYSGRTFVNDAVLSLMHEDSLPDFTDLQIVSGQVQIGYTATQLKPLGHVRITGGGALTEVFQGQRGSGRFSFELLELEDGTFQVDQLHGSGDIYKRTIGDANLVVSNKTSSTFNGRVIVEEGYLNMSGVKASQVLVKGGAITVGDMTGTVELAGGTLRLRNDFSSFETNVGANLLVTSDSRIVVSRHEGVNVSLSGTISGPGSLEIASFEQHPLSQTSVLTITSSNPNYSAPVRIDSVVVGMQWDNSLGSGPVDVVNGGVLKLGSLSNRNYVLKNDVTLHNGELDGSRIENVMQGDLTVSGLSYVRQLQVHGATYLAPDSRMTVNGMSETMFVGPILVASHSEVWYGGDDTSSLGTSQNPWAQFVGEVRSNSSQSVLNFVGLGVRPALFDLSLHASAGQTLTLLHNGLPFDQTISGSDDSVSGSGIIANNVTLTDGATISPGNSPGILTIDGDLTMTGGSRLAIEIGGTTHGVDYDTLVVTGALDLQNALLDVSFINGFTPMLGDTFSIIEAGSLSGRFASVPDSIRVGNYALELDYGPSGLAFTTVRVPEPATVAVMGLLVLGLMSRRLRGRA